MILIRARFCAKLGCFSSVPAIQSYTVFAAVVCFGETLIMFMFEAHFNFRVCTVYDVEGFCVIIVFATLSGCRPLISLYLLYVHVHVHCCNAVKHRCQPCNISTNLSAIANLALCSQSDSVSSALLCIVRPALYRPPCCVSSALLCIVFPALCIVRHALYRPPCSISSTLLCIFHPSLSPHSCFLFTLKVGRVKVKPCDNI